MAGGNNIIVEASSIQEELELFMIGLLEKISEKIKTKPQTVVDDA